MASRLLIQRRVVRVATAFGLALVASAFSRSHTLSPVGGGDPIVEAAHMRMTALGAPAPGDAEHAAQVLAALRAGLKPYADYHQALAEGFTIFAPNRRQPVYHFTNRRRALLSAVHFDPSQPTSLLYEKVGDDYRLVGAMYTAPRWTSLAELNRRVPLSVAQWHEHTNWCLPQRDEMARLDERGADGRPLFGGRGTIVTAAGCSAAGGRFIPQAFGWMVHVYPTASTPAAIWGRDAMHEMAEDHDMGEMAGMSGGATGRAAH
jgi:hypothetical protein